MKQLKLTILILVLALTGCTGPGEVFESRTYGVRNSQWYLLNTSERYAAKQSYLQEQALEEQRHTNRLIRQQNEDMRRAQLDATYRNTHRLQIDQMDRQASISRHQQTIYQDTQRSRQASDESLAIEEAKRRSLLSNQREQEQRDIAEAKRRSLLSNQREQEQRDIAEAKRQSLLSNQREQEQRDIAEAKRQSLLSNQHEQEQRDIAEATRRSLITQQRDQENRDFAEAKRQSLITGQREQAQRQQAQEQKQRADLWKLIILRT